MPCRQDPAEHLSGTIASVACVLLLMRTIGGKQVLLGPKVKATENLSDLAKVSYLVS